MYLSQVNIAWVWAKNSYQWHRALWQLFPDRPEAQRDFLFRIERIQAGLGAMVLLQSRHEPLHSEAANLLATKQIDLHFPQNSLLRFKLRANPVKTIKDELNRKNRKGTVKSCRVPLTREEEQMQWLQRKLQGAADLQTARATKEKPIYFHKKESSGGKIQPVCFEGILSILDEERFYHLITNGIGPAKGMGCGLLSLAKT